MTQEDKELLLKDLCARLPYFENWVQFEGKDYIVTGYGHGRVGLLPSLVSSAVGPCPLVEEVKPYLRPMYSMTKEEANIINKLVYDKEDSFLSPISIWVINESDVDKYIDFCLSHHLDYRGLIKKGLALEAPEGMYKTE